MTDQALPKKADLPASVKSYARYLLIMAGLGGLLYGIDVGVISAAIPYIEQTSDYNPGQISLLVAAVLLGSAISSLFTGILADFFGRKKIIILAAALFSLSIPVICLSNYNFEVFLTGRLLQGVSAGLVGVAVPLYLAECLGAESRGKGTGMFQFLLTVGLLFAAIIGAITAYFVEEQISSGVIGEALDSVKIFAWQLIFWICLIPGLALFFGSFKLSESPRWLFRKGRKEEALASLARNNGEEAAKEIYAEMVHNEEESKKQAEINQSNGTKDSLLQKKYVFPFILAVLILGFTQATGINSVLPYSVKIFQQGGLEGAVANNGDMAIKLVNCLMTIVAIALVDRKGRKFLLKLGTSGIVVGLMGAGFLFYQVEKDRIDVTDTVVAMVEAQKTVNTKAHQNNPTLKASELNDLNLNLADPVVIKALGVSDGQDLKKTQIIVTYVQKGEKTPWYQFGSGADLKVSNFEEKNISKNANGEKIEAFAPGSLVIQAQPDSDKSEEGYIPKDIEIIKAEIGNVPNAAMGWGVVTFFIIFIAFYAVGPGVCVWLALSELMPSRIRSNGMAIALLVNQTVSTVIAGSFLPWAGSSGYSGVIFTLGGITVLYLLTVTFFLPETKNRTLEEIEEYFTTGKMPPEKGQS